MSDTTTRERALAAALQLHEVDAPAATVVGTANLFLAFLNGDKALDSPKAEKSVTPAAKKGAAAATTAATAPVTEPKTVGDTKPATPAASASPSDEAVGKAIGAMLSANLKAECKALLAKFGATNKSTLKAEHFAAFVAEANDVLMAE